MKLSSVIPWGRSLEEYRSMFSLKDEDLTKNILGCGDGPASFNSELTTLGGDIVSVDPIYEFEALSLKSRIAEVYDDVIAQMEGHKDQYIWESIPSVTDLGRVRMNSMNKFISDYESGKREGRYINAKLPDLNFKDNTFDLALCSHYLFLYSILIDEEQHFESIKEMCRVADEVRIFPVVSLDGKESIHLSKVISKILEFGLNGELVPVSYRFQKGATQMLVIRKASSL